MSLAVFACSRSSSDDADEGGNNLGASGYANTTEDSPSEPIVLKLATFHHIDADAIIPQLVADFHREYTGYRVEVVDYSQFNRPGPYDTTGMTMLLTEIIAGNPPDIIDVSSFPVIEYASRGLFADLYQFIDADPEISRGDFTEGVLQAFEFGGNLYYVSRNFTIATIAGNPYFLGSSAGWNINEFKDVLTANPQADVPLGPYMDKMTFLNWATSVELDKFVDWETGTAYFNSPEYVGLLEFADTFPNNPDYTLNESETIATGRQIMSQTWLSGFPHIALHKALYGGEVVYKGFPNDSRDGHAIMPEFSLAITENSPHKEAAWLFVRAILDTYYQYDGYRHYMYLTFPTMQAAFDKRAHDALEEDYLREMEALFNLMGYGDIPIEILTQSDIDQVLALTVSASVLLSWHDTKTIDNIIREEAPAYFNGSRSAQEAADIIQSRVSRYISERS